jgi:hypothetical protein
MKSLMIAMIFGYPRRPACGFRAGQRLYGKQADQLMVGREITNIFQSWKRQSAMWLSRRAI